MPPVVGPWRPGKVVGITFQEVDSELRLTDDQGAGPTLIGSEGNVKETIKHHKCVDLVIFHFSFNLENIVSTSQ